MRLALLTLAFAACAFSQAPPTVVSPEVHNDRRVTFRLYAPKADEAAFFGDWMKPGSSEKMSKGADGVWTITVGPLQPSVYIYNFLLDGVAIADPVNPRIKLRARTSASMVEVRGGSTEPWVPRDVPHGSVRIEHLSSKVLPGDPRGVWIYTPPGYDRNTKQRYPVLYLFHGSNDTAGGWVLAGHANFILDNLIAERKAAPMLVVMPFGHAVPFGSPREEQAKNVALHEQYVMKDVLPFVEANYRVLTDRRNRAVAGLSMGGGQALHVAFSHPKLFRAVGAFSAAVPGDFEAHFAAGLTSADARPDLIWIACGKDDFIYDRSEKLAALLTARKVPHTWRPTEGNHTFTYWRQYLAEFVPLLFQ